jgi:hypothetical protein
VKTLKRFAPPALVGLAMGIVVAASAHAGPVAVPDNLKLPPQTVEMLRVGAAGFQIYACQPRAGDPSAFEWTLKAPDADLLNEAGETIGKHYAGPAWEALDGSKVVGEVVERAPAPSLGAIPWLLLRAKATEGAGIFSTVRYVQRLDTIGGSAPTEGCDRASAGAELSVPYQATYAFAYGAAE